MKSNFYNTKIPIFSFSGLYGLVNNAGICVCGEFEWLTWKQIQRQVEVNLLGTMRVTKYCMPLLKPTQGNSFLIWIEFTIEMSFFDKYNIVLEFKLYRNQRPKDVSILYFFLIKDIKDNIAQYSENNGMHKKAYFYLFLY